MLIHIQKNIKAFHKLTEDVLLDLIWDMFVQQSQLATQGILGLVCTKVALIIAIYKKKETS